MSMNVRTLKTLVAVLAVAIVVPGIGLASETDTDRVIEAFLNQVDESGSLTNEQKAMVRETVDQYCEDDQLKTQAISGALFTMYPDYEDALMAADEGADKAQSALNPMIESDDKYLVADATFYLARILMSEDRHEEAIPLLASVTSDLAEFTLNAGNAVYFTAVAEANMLKNKKAVELFEKFLKENPKAPERLKVSAWRQIELLKSIEDGSLSDVYQRMDFSRRRLDLEKTGDVTQEQQDKIVKMLDKLIKEQEKKECSSCSSSCNNPSEGEQPADSQAQNPGQGKSNKGGTSNQKNGVVRRSFDNGPASPWSKLRDRSRDPANTAVKEKLPARYRKAVEEYNEAVNESEDSNN